MEAPKSHPRHRGPRGRDGGRGGGPGATYSAPSGEETTSGGALTWSDAVVRRAHGFALTIDRRSQEGESFGLAISKRAICVVARRRRHERAHGKGSRGHPVVARVGRAA